MFNSSAISVMVNLRLTVTHPLILLMFSSVFAVDGLPLHWSSSTDSRPLLKRSCQRKTFYLFRVSLPKHFSNIFKVCALLNPFLTQNLMQTRFCKGDDIFFCEKSKPHTKIDVHNTASLQQMSSYQAENLTERRWHFYQHKKKEEFKSAERERHTVTSPKTFWSTWYLATSLVQRPKRIASRAYLSVSSL